MFRVALPLLCLTPTAGERGEQRRCPAPSADVPLTRPLLSVSAGVRRRPLKAVGGAAMGLKMRVLNHVTPLVVSCQADAGNGLPPRPLLVTSLCHAQVSCWPHLPHAVWDAFCLNPCITNHSARILGFRRQPGPIFMVVSGSRRAPPALHQLGAFQVRSTTLRERTCPHYCDTPSQPNTQLDTDFDVFMPRNDMNQAIGGTLARRARAGRAPSIFCDPCPTGGLLPLICWTTLYGFAPWPPGHQQMF